MVFFLYCGLFLEGIMVGEGIVLVIRNFGIFVLGRIVISCVVFGSLFYYIEFESFFC